MRRRLLLLLVAAALVTTGCSGAGAGTDAQQVVHWLDERPDVASVQERDGRVVVRLDEGRTDEQVWDFVEDFQAYAGPLDDVGDYRLDVDGYDAYLAPVVWGEKDRAETDGALVRALWLRADGRATAVTDGAPYSVSTLVTAPAEDVVGLALDLQQAGVDTDDSIRVASADATMAVQWTTRLDFGADVTTLRHLAALQRRFPHTRGWLSGIAGESEVGVVFSPRDISLDVLRRDHRRLVPWLTGPRAAIGWGTLLTDPGSLAEATADPGTRAAYADLAAVPGLVPSASVDALATDLASLRAARRVLAAHPGAGLGSLGYAPVPAPFVGHERDAVFEVAARLPRERWAAYEKVAGLPGVLEVTPHVGRLVLAAGIDDAQVRAALDVVRTLDPRPAADDVTTTVLVAAEPRGVRRWLGSTELAGDGTAVRGDAGPDERRDDATLERVEAAWADLVG